MPGHWPPGMPGHRAPVTGHLPTTGHLPITGQTGDVETSSLPITGHRPASHRSLELERLNPAEIQESPTTGHDRSQGSRPLVTGHQNIILTTASESHTFGAEFTSKQPSTPRVLRPLEPDLCNMSDPSIVIEPPGNNWRSDNNKYRQIQTSLSGRRSSRDQCRDKHRSKKRRRWRSASTSSSSTSSSSDSRQRKSKRSKHRLLLLPQYHIVRYMTMADTREVATGHRLYRTRKFYSLRKYLMSRQLHLNRPCLALQEIQVPTMKWKPDPLIGQSMRFLGFCLRSYAQGLPRSILWQGPYLVLSS